MSNDLATLERPQAATSAAFDWASIVDQERIVEIPLDMLHESPTNPRKFYSPIALAELAEDMKQHGRNLQPLLLRPIIPPMFAGDFAAMAGLEVVYGHRRLRALRLAGMPAARGEVRMLTDLQVRRMQISENLQREDVHPFEEAEGFRALIDEHGETPKSIAESIGGKSKLSYVYGRLRLLQACAEIRRACVAGEIGSEVALLIARVGPVKLQEKALGYIKGKALSLSDGGKVSTRRIKDLLNERFMLDLKKAPFPTKPDAEFMHISGSCEACPKRSGNAPEFVDVAEGKKPHHYSQVNVGPDICTDSDCFASKKLAYFKHQANQLRAKGREVVEGNKAMAAIDARGNVKGAYVPLQQVRSELDRAIWNARRDGRIPMPAAVLIQDPRTGNCVEAVKVSELIAAGARTAADKTSSSSGKGESQTHDQRRASQEAAANAQTQSRTALLHRVRAAAAAAQRNTLDMRLIAKRLLLVIEDSNDEEVLTALWSAQSVSEIGQWLDEMPPSDLATLMLDCVLVENVTGQCWNLDEEPESLIAAAAHYGVPLTQEAESTAAPSQAPANPSDPHPPAARAQSGAAGKAQAVTYRNAATGETWSGRGLQPKWMKAAIAAGARLEDFLANTPSTAARAQEGAQDAADAAANPEQPGGDAAQQVRVDDAGGAGVGSDAAADATEETEA